MLLKVHRSLVVILPGRWAWQPSRSGSGAGKERSRAGIPGEVAGHPSTELHGEEAHPAEDGGLLPQGECQGPFSLLPHSGVGRCELPTSSRTVPRSQSARPHQLLRQQ